MAITALLTIAKMWKQPTFPPPDEWIKKKLEYYSTNETKGILPFVATWIYLEGLMLK